MTPDLLDLAFHAHHVRNEHEMTDINEDTLFVQGRLRLVDDRIPGCLDPEDLGDLADVVRAGTGRIHTGNVKYIL